MEWLDKLMDKLEPKKIIKNSGKPQALGSAPTMYSIGEAGNTNLPSVPNGLENLKGIAAAMPKPPDNTGNEGPTPIPTSLWSKGHIDKGSTYEVFPASKEEPAGLTPGEMLNPEETGRVAPSEYGGIISTPTGKIYNIEKSKSPLTAEENIALNKQRGEDYSRYLDEKLAGIDTGIAQDRYNDYLRNYESTIEKNKSRYAKMASIASSDILMKNMSPGESKAFRTEFDALGQAIPQMQKDYGDKIKEGITAGAARETFLAQPGREITEAKTKAETEEAIARSGLNKAQTEELLKSGKYGLAYETQEGVDENDNKIVTKVPRLYDVRTGRWIDMSPGASQTPTQDLLPKENDTKPLQSGKTAIFKEGKWQLT